MTISERSPTGRPGTAGSSKYGRAKNRRVEPVSPDARARPCWIGALQPRLADQAGRAGCPQRNLTDTLRARNSRGTGARDGQQLRPSQTIAGRDVRRPDRRSRGRRCARAYRRGGGDPDALPLALAESSGLLLLQGMDAIAEEPALLVRLSRIFGPEVEDYRQTLTARHMVHDDRAGDLRRLEHSADEPASAAPARSAADRGRQAAGAVSPSPRLAHRPELSPPAARHLVVPRGGAGAARPGADAVCRRDRCL